MKYDLNSFYCINCGKRGLDIMRKASKKKEKFHRKKLYCPNCQKVVNHIECKNDTEVFEFKEDFEAGLFKEEAEESLRECEGD